MFYVKGVWIFLSVWGLAFFDFLRVLALGLGLKILVLGFWDLP